MPTEEFASNTVSLFYCLNDLSLTLASVNSFVHCTDIFRDLSTITLGKHCYDPRAINIKGFGQLEYRLSCKIIGGISNES